MVKVLLEHKGVETNTRTLSGWTPLSLATARGHEAVVRVLLAKDDINLDLKDNSGQTPLLTAVQNRREGVVNWLARTS